MLKLDNVCYRYSRSTQDVLKNVSAEMDAGKLHAIIGPSGSGKTTLLSIMAGMDTPTSGAVHLSGENLAGMDLDQYRRERVSMVFQAFHLFPLLTAVENVCYPMETQGVAKKEARTRAKDLLVLMGRVKNYEKAKAKWSGVDNGENGMLPVYYRKTAGSFLDWLMPCIYKFPPRDAFGSEF